MAGSGVCRNCTAPMGAEQLFCGGCGQRIGPARLTMGQILHDFMHALTHADHSIFSLMKDLILRPGRVAREYVEGKRKKYFGPFAFLVISVGLASLVVALTGVEWFKPIPDARAGGFLQRHINLVMLIQVPMLAALNWLLFRSERFNYAEHLVFTAYTSAIRVLVFALVITPAVYFNQMGSTRGVALLLYFSLWTAYYAFAAVQFYRGNVFWKILRAALATILAQAAITFLVYVFMVSSMRLAPH
jgi:Protein of unknown function (DUF3667)